MLYTLFGGIINAEIKYKKSTIRCSSNQPCLFEHSVLTHAKVQSVLCQISSVESTKENDTMLLLENQPTRQTENQPKVRRTYSQVWSAYNQAQTNEKSRFLELLYELCKQIEDMPPAHTGRTRIPLSDMVFAVVYKTYSLFSGRRFISDLVEAHKKGYISKIPHFNSLFNYLEIDEMFYILQALIKESAKPLKTVEVDFAVDSSGFSKGTTVTWLHEKYSNPHEIEKKDWVKCHLICGVITNIVASVEVTEGSAGDSPEFEGLVNDTAKTFNINQVSADKAYLSAHNFRVVDNHGGMAFIPFKENSRPNHRTKDALWRNMYYYFQLHQDEYMNYYHKRSNVETTFSMIKAKFGERIKSKTEKAQINELLCKVLCHNLCCVIQSIYELGIETEFYRE